MCLLIGTRYFRIPPTKHEHVAFCQTYTVCSVNVYITPPVYVHLAFLYRVYIQHTAHCVQCLQTAHYTLCTVFTHITLNTVHSVYTQHTAYRAQCLQTAHCTHLNFYLMKNTHRYTLHTVHSVYTEHTARWPAY